MNLENNLEKINNNETKNARSTKSRKKEPEKIDLEKNLTRMSEIVKIMEDSSTNLDEKIKLYQEGVMLSKICLDELDKAKGKITEIKNGKEENIDNG